VKIIALQAENVKRLSAVEIRPDGNLVEITGKNGQGKTSVLDAIAWALEGTTHIQAQPIRKGWTEALIKLDLGEIKVTRKFKAKEDGGYTTSIMVENSDGARFPSPQSMLDKLIGELAFDPLAFTRMKPADQFETLKRFVPGVNFADIEAAHKKDFDERTNLNRRVKELKAQAEGVTVPEGAGPDGVDERALVAKLEAAGEHNADIERRRANREQAMRDVDDKRADAQECLDQADHVQKQIAELEKKRDGLRDTAKLLVESADELKAKLAAAGDLPEPIDTADIRRQIDAARATNAGVAAFQRRAELVEQAKEVEAKATALTKAIEERQAAKAKAIAEAKMPIEGIGFGEGVVMLGGVPFDQASDAQQLAASIAIAAAMNPKLRVIRVRDGSLLDEDALKMLGAFADQHDMQVWIERVDSSGRIGFVLEDGRLKDAPAPAPAQGASL